MKIEPFTFGKTYHIYNRGIDGCNIFRENENYKFFLRIYDKHLSVIAETYAWVLMPNHFHFLIRINERSKVEKIGNIKKAKKQPSQHLSNLFNAYTKSFNNIYERHGALFERPFKRKIIQNENQLITSLIYIHKNPVHHKFCQFPSEYRWSSYLTYLSEAPTKLERHTILRYLGGRENFIYLHNQ